jgi:hypothetical protein
MLRFSALALLCLAATPALAQNQAAPAAPAAPAPAGPPPEAVAAVQQAAMTFSQCIQTGIGGVPANVTPEAGATNVISGCGTQRGALEGAVQALIGTLPEERRPMALEQMRSQLAGLPAQVAAGISQMRAASAPAAAPAATPAH